MNRGAAEAIGDGGTFASQTASFLDLLAPGDIMFNSGNPGGVQAGMSFAAPHVAGAFAVLRGLKPFGSVDDMFNTLVATGIPVTDSRATPNITTPRLQLNAAVEAFTQRPLPPTNLTASPELVIPWLEIGVFLLIALAASLLMAWIPSRRAARVPIAAALRYE